MYTKECQNLSREHIFGVWFIYEQMTAYINNTQSKEFDIAYYQSAKEVFNDIINTYFSADSLYNSECVIKDKITSLKQKGHQIK